MGLVTPVCGPLLSLLEPPLPHPFPQHCGQPYNSQTAMFTLCINVTAVLRVGFINEPYIEHEDNGFQTVTVQVLDDLAKSIVVRLTSEPSGDPNEATGKPT